MKVVGYVRVSTAGQKDNHSIPEQAKRIQGYCDMHGLELVAIFQEVGSGANTARGGFKDAIRTIWGRNPACAEVDGLIVWDFWRFSRDLRDSENIRAGFVRRNKQLLSVNQSFNLGEASGVFAFQVTQAAGENDRRNIAARLYGHRKAKVDAGNWIGHGIPYGAEVQKRVIDGRAIKVLVKNQQTYPTVELILSMTGTTRSIAERLNAKGIPSPTGTPWNNVSVWKIKKRDYSQLLAG